MINDTSDSQERIKFDNPNPPISAKSNKICQSNTEDAKDDMDIPANEIHVRERMFDVNNVLTINTIHANPANMPSSTIRVKCELTRVRTLIPFGSMNVDTILPEFPKPTPPRKLAVYNSRPANHIFGRFAIAPSMHILGNIQYVASETVAM